MTSMGSQVDKIYTKIVFEPNETGKKLLNLLQEPKEEITVNISSNKMPLIKPYTRDHFNIVYLILFQEYPISILKNYVYEVRCKALIEKEGFEMMYYNFPSLTTMRTQSKIDLEHFLVLPLNTNIKQLYLSIHRFHIKNNFCSSETYTISPFIRRSFSPNVTLAVQDKNILAHKAVLSARSAVFEAMFAHQIAENKSEVVRISGVHPEVVQEMIDYVYSGKTKKLYKFPLDLFKLAHKYQLHELARKCREHMLFNITPKNVLDIQKLPSFCYKDELIESTNIYIKENEDAMMKEHSYRQFLCESLNATNLIENFKLFIKYNLIVEKMYVLYYIKCLIEDIQDGTSRKYLSEYFKDEPECLEEALNYFMSLKEEEN